MRFVPAILAIALAPAYQAQGVGLTLSQALSIATPVRASSDTPRSALSLEDAVRLALDAQPQLAQLVARVREARENATAEGQLPDPRLTLGLTNLPVDSFSFTEEDMTQVMVGISQMVPGGDKRRLASRRMILEAARGEAELAAARLRIARGAAHAWLNVYAPRQAMELVKRIEAEYDREVEWAGVAYATGGLGQADSLALRMMREYVLDRQAELRRDEARARLELARWLGEAASRQPTGGALPQRPTLDPQRWEESLDAHPELAILVLDVDVAQAEADLARESYKPDWSVDVGYGLRGGGRSDMISVVVGVDLPLFTQQRQDRRMAARQAGLEGVQSGLEDRRRQLAAELGAAHADWQTADRRIAHFEATLIPLAQRRVESAMAAYRTGKAEFSMVLEARRAELEARLQLLRLDVERARAAIDLRYYLGEAPASLGSPGYPVKHPEGS